MEPNFNKIKEEIEDIKNFKSYDSNYELINKCFRDITNLIINLKQELEIKDEEIKDEEIKRIIATIERIKAVGGAVEPMVRISC